MPKSPQNTPAPTWITKGLTQDERFILGRLAPWLALPDCSLSVAIAMTLPESVFCVAVEHAQNGASPAFSEAIKTALTRPWFFGSREQSAVYYRTNNVSRGCVLDWRDL